MEKIRVLVVDDSPFSQKMIERALADSRYEICDFADTGGEGVEKFRSCAPDIVTMDLTLPDMDGLACCREILIRDPHAKILVLSAMKDEVLINSGTAIGVRGFLQKPVNTEELIEGLDEVLEEEQHAEQYKEELLQYFVRSLKSNLVSMAGMQGKSSVTPSTGVKLVCDGLAIVIGITGTRQGRLVLNLSMEDAERFTAKILGTSELTEDDIINSISEFANIIAGHGVSQANNVFKSSEFELRLTPPSVFIGKSLVIINNKMASSTVTMQTEVGPFYMNVGFVGGE